ncbi:MAG TPA: nitrite reductase small subunit NirD [Gammaproteobacteria bacterium]|nr:nitrite reductase small subunit NirD [Gammaproteobacteria bacterium]
MTWLDAGPLDAIPMRGARVLRVGRETLALFRTSEGLVYALRDRCPHRGGPLSQGIVHGARVTCPLHDWVIDLATGRAAGPDVGCTATFPVHVLADRVLVSVDDETP